MDDCLDKTKKADSFSDVPPEIINRLGSYYDNGEAQRVIDLGINLTKRFPKAANLQNLIGASFAQKGDFARSSEFYSRAICLEPNVSPYYINLGYSLLAENNYSEASRRFSNAISLDPHSYPAYNGLATAEQKRGNLNLALKHYETCLALNPGSAEANNNKGTCLLALGDIQGSIIAYTQALHYEPRMSEAHNNLGAAYQRLGKLTEAGRCFQTAISLKNDYKDALLNYQGLTVQSDQFTWSKSLEDACHKELASNPKFLIRRAIKSLCLGNTERLRADLEDYERLDPKILLSSSDKERHFCSTFHAFLTSLKGLQPVSQSSPTEYFYHLGESHCLSFANQTITYRDKRHKILPSITFGAKAFHFSAETANNYTEMTRLNLSHIPQGSSVLISFGEIDCRLKEGFIPASAKLNVPIPSLISETINGYLRWFRAANEKNNHSYYFLNVPAPFYQEKSSRTENEVLSETIRRYNEQLKSQTEKFSLKMLDCYSKTVGPDGYSNSDYHIDRVHLGPKFLPELERQLAEL